MHLAQSCHILGTLSFLLYLENICDFSFALLLVMIFLGFLTSNLVVLRMSV